MTAWSILLAGGGSGVGAVARYALGRSISGISNREFPWGTWVVNMLGTLLLGLFFQEFTVLHRDVDWYMLLGTGFCGGFTTFSTMSVEAVQLFKKRIILGAVYLGSSLGLGFVLAWMAQWLL